jgi:hypothetical protein
MVTLPPLRHRLGSSASGGRQLSSEGLHVYACLHLVSSASSELHRSSSSGSFAAPLRWQMLCRFSSLADALPPLLF